MPGQVCPELPVIGLLARVVSGDTAVSAVSPDTTLTAVSGDSAVSVVQCTDCTGELAALNAVLSSLDK